MDLNEDATASSSDADFIAILEQFPEAVVPISRLAPGFHLRAAGISPARVRLLADAAGSVRLVSILVQRSGSRIIDGLHRVVAAKLRGERQIRARIVDCTDQEALLIAIRSNILHGLPLSRPDRISAAQRIRAARPDWSDQTIATITGLGAETIRSLPGQAAGQAPFNGKRLGRDGQRRSPAALEGRRRAAGYLCANPDAPIRQVAREADVSVGTARNVRAAMPRGQGEVIPPTASPPTAAALRDTQAPSWPALRGKLSSDPALRYTDDGRAFLRWLALHAMLEEEWLEFIDVIPLHWMRDVSQLADDMSRQWRQFAVAIRKRKLQRGR